MNSPSASVVLTTILACPSIGSPPLAQVVTNPTQASYHFFEVARPRRDEASDVDDFVESLKSEFDIGDDLAEARKWLAQTNPEEATTLRSLRLNKGMSQTDLANAIGLKQPNVSAFESGERIPALITVRRLSVALEVSADEIINALENVGAFNG